MMRNWDVFREMERLHRDIDGAFEDFGLGKLLGPAFEPSPTLRRDPRINLREDQENLYVDALLPGVDPDQIKLSVLGETLTLAGERAVLDEPANSQTWHRRERSGGKFMRTIELPTAIAADKVKAEAHHGLLRVTLPKAVAAKPKKVSIKVR